MPNQQAPIATLFAIPAYAIKAEEILRDKAEHFITSLNKLNIKVDAHFHDPSHNAQHHASHFERRGENQMNKSLILHFRTPDNKEHIVRIYHSVGEHIVYATYTPQIGITNPKELPDFKATWIPHKLEDNTPHGLHGLLQSLKQKYGELIHA